ncbi:methylenetetrahydrofolate reductase [Luteibacter aegosomaticola]|uniref:methylenetetrahydrofolate reductase n=1 Tax=Luteibacter aegosomaticola TaxID=2911538 RepID=UPI001FF8C529|nr:methylenetetrahydrofolate reductase [Luteibacter aegosomaticola]UPG90534.1 methylenetetrahydrofolate reductase [Luteibacter aegosomaticola]
MNMNHLMDGYSLEVSAKAIPALAKAASRIAPGSIISIPYLPNEDDEARLAAARAVRALGFTPMPHLAARRITSQAELESFIHRAVTEAGVEHCFVIAGDPATPKGPFPDSASLIESGLYERAGIKVLGVGGHPDDHPVMDVDHRWEVLEQKCQSIARRGMAPLIVTQFTFDADIALAWLATLRERGINYPVRLGVPGPAGIAVLARYAAMCGVGACASMWSKYGISLGKLLGTAGPEHFVDRLAAGLTAGHGDVRLHFFPFGGVEQSVKWISEYRSHHGLSQH